MYGQYWVETMQNWNHTQVVNSVLVSFDLLLMHWNKKNIWKCVCLSSSMQFATRQLIKVGHVHAKPSALSMIPQYSCNKSVTNCFQATNPPQQIWNRRRWTKLTMATAETSLQRWLNAYLEVIWQNNTWNTPLLDTMVIKQWNTEISISCNWFWHFWIYVANSCRPSVFVPKVHCVLARFNIRGPWQWRSCCSHNGFCCFNFPTLT